VDNGFCSHFRGDCGVLGFLAAVAIAVEDSSIRG
jgi:hypothetical protein